MARFKPFMPIRPISEALGLTYMMVYRLVRSGEVKSIRSGKKYYVNTKDLCEKVGCDYMEGCE